MQIKGGLNAKLRENYALVKKGAKLLPALNPLLFIRALAVALACSRRARAIG